jgi:hypothetical protein
MVATGLFLEAPAAASLFIGNVSLLLAGGGSYFVCQNSVTFQLAVCSSSIRYKKNINNFSPGLRLLNRLRPVTFNWKNDNKADVGLIAEEVGASNLCL